MLSFAMFASFPTPNVKEVFPVLSGMNVRQAFQAELI
jgi:hypothetical protein